MARPRPLSLVVAATGSRKVTAKKRSALSPRDWFFQHIEEEVAVQPRQEPSRRNDDAFTSDLKDRLSTSLSTLYKAQSSRRAYVESTQSAPNPIITIDGLGHVGMPLSKGDAERIRKKGRGFHPPEKVKTLNPEWVKYVESAFEEVVRDLQLGGGGGGGGGKPELVMQGLFVVKANTDLSGHPPIQPKPSTRAWLCVVLPTSIIDNTWPISVNAKKVDVQVNYLTTTIFAWPADAKHPGPALPSAGCIAVLYAIEKEAVPIQAPAVESNELRAAFKLWNENKFKSPMKLVYPFSAEGTGEQLGVADTHFVDVVRAVGEESGVCVGYGLLRSASDGKPSSDPPPYGAPASSGKARAPLRVSGMHFSGPILMHAESLPCGRDEVIIVPQLDGRKQPGLVDKLKSAGPLHTARVLVLWPTAHEGAITYGEDYTSIAVRQLEAEPGASPRHLVDYFLNSNLQGLSKTLPLRIFRSICWAACYRDDVEIWKRAAKKFDKAALSLPEDSALIVKAWRMWCGVPEVKASITVAINNVKANSEIWNLLEMALGGEPNAAEDERWKSALWETCFGGIKKLLPADVPRLSDLVRKYGDFGLYEAHVIPNLKNSWTRSTALEFASALSNELNLTDGDKTKLKSAIVALLETISAKTFTSQALGGVLISSDTATAGDHADFLLRFSRLCEKHDRVELFTPLVDRLVGLGRRVHLDAVLLVEKLVLGDGPNSKKLGAKVIELVGSVWARGSGSHPAAEDVAFVSRMVVKGCWTDEKTFHSCITAPLLEYCKNFREQDISSLIDWLMGTLASLKTCGSHPLLDKTSRELVMRGSRRIAALFTSRSAAVHVTKAFESKEVPMWFAFCAQLGGANYVRDAIKEFLGGVGAPAILRALESLEERASDPANLSWVRESLVRWRTDYLSATPSLNMGVRISDYDACTQSHCTTCHTLDRFLQTPSADKSMEFRSLKTDVYNHIDQRLREVGAERYASWEAFRVFSVTRSLRVTKKDELYKSQERKAQQAKCVALLKKIFVSEDLVRNGLGLEEYSMFKQALGVERIHGADSERGGDGPPAAKRIRLTIGR